MPQPDSEPYYRLHKLTREQRSLIGQYMKFATEVVAESVDMVGRPVINFRDANGWRDEPFAINAKGATCPPYSPLVPLTLEDVHPEDHDILYGIIEGE